MPLPTVDDLDVYHCIGCVLGPVKSGRWVRTDTSHDMLLDSLELQTPLLPPTAAYRTRTFDGLRTYKSPVTSLAENGTAQTGDVASNANDAADDDDDVVVSDATVGVQGHDLHPATMATTKRHAPGITVGAVGTRTLRAENRGNVDVDDDDDDDLVQFALSPTERGQPPSATQTLADDVAVEIARRIEHNALEAEHVRINDLTAKRWDLGVLRYMAIHTAHGRTVTGFVGSLAHLCEPCQQKQCNEVEHKWNMGRSLLECYVTNTPAEHPLVYG